MNSPSETHPTSTSCHTQVSGKKVRTVSIGGGPPAAPPNPAPVLYFLMAMIRGDESRYTEQKPHRVTGEVSVVNTFRQLRKNKSLTHVATMVL